MKQTIIALQLIIICLVIADFYADVECKVYLKDKNHITTTVIGTGTRL